jgi:hypothetical protein
MSGAVFSADGLSLSPSLQRRLAPDYLDRSEQIGDGTDFALPQRLLDLQRALLNFLMSDGLAARVLDSANKVDRPADALGLSEMYQRVRDDVWSELRSGHRLDAPIPAGRRELQRSHVSRLAAALLRPSPFARADSRGLVRVEARVLLGLMKKAAGGAVDGRRSFEAGAGTETRIHLAESIDTLSQALAANVQRQSL